MQTILDILTALPIVVIAVLVGFNLSQAFADRYIWQNPPVVSKWVVVTGLMSIILSVLFIFLQSGVFLKLT